MLASESDEKDQQQSNKIESNEINEDQQIKNQRTLPTPASPIMSNLNK
jgi:hypothetical protein